MFLVVTLNMNFFHKEKPSKWLQTQKLKLINFNRFRPFQEFLFSVGKKMGQWAKIG